MYVDKNPHELYIPQPEFIGIFRESIAKKADFRFKASGYSMLPAIRWGDILTISPTSIMPVSVGDVVAFVRPVTEKLVVHRVVCRRGGGYIIKGDNVFGFDGLVPQDRVIGRLKRVERGGREVYFGMGAGKYLMLLFSVLRVFSVLSFSLSLIRKIFSWKKVTLI